MEHTNIGAKRNGWYKYALGVGLVCLAAARADALTLLQDDFNDDIVGLGPNGPQVGSATYGSGVLTPPLLGQYVVVDDAGQQRLRATSAGPPNDPANGTIIEFTPTSSTARHLRVQYEFQVEPGGVSAGWNAWDQEITFGPLGTNLLLFWSSAADGRQLYLASSTPGCCAGGFVTVALGRSYAPGTTYSIDWRVDLANDRYALWFDGVALVADASFGTDVLAISQLVLANNFATTGSALIDNVLIRAVPEPAVWASMLAGLLLIGARVVRRSRTIAGT